MSDSQVLRLVIDLAQRGVELQSWQGQLLIRSSDAVTAEDREAVASMREKLVETLAPARFGLDRPDLPALLALRHSLEASPLPRELPGLVAWARSHRTELACGEARAAALLSSLLAPGNPGARIARSAALWRGRLEQIRSAANRAGATLSSMPASWLLPYHGPLRALLEALDEVGLLTPRSAGEDRRFFDRLVLALDGEEVPPTNEAVPWRLTSSTGDTDPPKPCRCCGHTDQWWRLRDPVGLWICGRCNPPMTGIGPLDTCGTFLRTGEDS